MRLHLGCGDKHIDGFINVDIRKTSATDITDNVVYLMKFDKKSVDLIYASNVLEHIDKFQYMYAMKNWYRVLKDGGMLRVSVPDFEAMCAYYCQTQDLRSVYPSLYGGHKDEYDFHKRCWDFQTLKEDLESVGFKNVRRYDKFKTEHSLTRDWSTDYLPYHDKDGNELPDEEWFKGIDIALNVEADK
jgi:predicted SAM-dependent methyltransferase